MDPLWVFLIVGAKGLDPALRENVAHRAGQSLEALSLVGSGRVDHGVEPKVALKECTGSAGKRDGPEIAKRELFRQRVDVRGLIHDALLRS